MNRYYYLQTFALLIGMLSAHGQVNLAEMDITSSDSLQKSRISFFSPGTGGMNRIWDFSQKLSSDGSVQVMFQKDSAEVLSVAEPTRIAYYLFTDGSLKQFAGESPTDRRDYTIPKLTMKFPLVYGDSVSSPFRCDGVYCGDHPYRESGMTTVKVDAAGSIVLAENDTLRDVKRVHTVNSYTICMDISYEALDTAATRQVIEERYEWYLPGSHYPIIENVSSTSYCDLEAFGTTRYAYCNLPDNQVPSYITPVEELTDNELDGFLDGELQLPDIIHYRIESHGGNITISYDLDEDATITTIVASHTGMSYKYNTWCERAGQNYSCQIDCSGLAPGFYILYINVNGKVYSEKVTL